MTVRYYSSVAAETTLVGSITSGSTSIQLASTVGLPALTPFTLALDYEGASEELVEVSAVAGPTLTVTRAIDGTSATTHNAGARVRHVSSARDFSDSRNHENASTNVHGIGASSSVVGTATTQTLSNKTLNAATGTLDRIDITSSGAAWTTSVSGLLANVVDLFRWKQDPASTHEVASISNSGGFKARNATVGADSVLNTYRLRATKEDGTTDIFYALSGGSVKTFPDLNQSGFTVQPRSANSTTRAISVRDQADTVDRFVVWQDGHTDVNGSDPAFVQFDVTGAPGQSASYSRVLDSTGNTLFGVSSTARTTLAGAGDIRNDFNGTGTSAVVLRVFGRQPGQTGDLTQWIDSTNTVVAKVDAEGDFTLGPTKWNQFTPVWVGIGSATFTRNIGWTKKLGKIVFYEIYAVWATDGTGTAGVQVNFPTTPFREGLGANTTRQAVTGHITASNGGVIDGVCSMYAFAGDSGTLSATLRRFDGIVCQGNNFVANTIVTIQGWYREQ